MSKYTEALSSIYYTMHYRIKPKGLARCEDSSLEALQELVDKATPHKLLKNGLCLCGARVIISFQGYCTQCGQALDWSEEE